MVKRILIVLDDSDFERIKNHKEKKRVDENLSKLTWDEYFKKLHEE